MNNSYVAASSEPETPDLKEKLRERESKVLKIIEAINGVRRTKDWSTLTTELFSDLATSLRRDLLSEAQKETPDPLKLNRLSGQLKWANSYADLGKLEERFRLELKGIRSKIESHG